MSVINFVSSLGCHGLRHWRRVFLLPWLTFYLLVLGLVTTLLLSALHSNNFLMQWRHVFLFFAVFTIFYCWSHVKRQFIMMALPRPDEVTGPACYYDVVTDVVMMMMIMMMIKIMMMIMMRIT